MASDLSNYGANYLLDLLITNKNIWWAPSTTLPALDGSNVTPPVQSDFVRAQSSTWAAATNRAKTTSAVLNFINGGGNALGNAGPFPYLAGYDVSTLGSGNFIARVILSQSLAWVAGQPVTIAAGDLTLSYPP